MPYRRIHTTIQVLRQGRWENLKGGTHKTVEEAEAQLTALRINVESKERK